VEATRAGEQIVMGVSPRGNLALLRCAKVYAYLDGRDYVTPDKACISKEGNGDLPDFGPARYFAGDKGKGLDAVLKASCVTKEQDVRRGRQTD